MNNPITSPKNLFGRLRFFALITFLCFYSNLIFAQPSFCLSNEQGATTITVDITVENFNSIIGMQFPITWDPAVLEFDSVANYNLPTGTSGSVGNFGYNQTDNGKLLFSWNSSGLDPITFPDGSIIFSLVFNFIGNGFTTVQIDENDPFPIEVIHANNTVWSSLDIDTKAGSINGVGFPLSGNLFVDTNLNCSYDLGEQGIPQWILKVENNNINYYATTEIDGSYSIYLDTGDYVITPQIINNLWQGCQTSYTITMDGTNNFVQDIPIKPILFCPLMTVDIATPFLRRCFENKYTISYCNDGTTIANGAFVEVELDSFLSVTSSSIPVASQNGNIYTFNIGDIEPFQCGDFTIDVYVSCDADLGDTHCTTVNIFPNEICELGVGWSGANIEISGNCNPTSEEIEFTVKNIGDGNMSNGTTSIVIEDAVMMLTSPSVNSLNVDESQVISFPANGSTFRMEIEQVPNHPFGGKVIAVIEGCGENTNGEFSTGFINQFSLEDNNPFTAIDCRQNIGAYDPNDKQAFPRGYGDQNYIKANTDLEYLIRFQNTGTDTAFNVIVLDTLSSLLNVGSFRLGASSHPVDFEMTGNGVAIFKFNNIMLPDSNVNESASHGFVQFKIAQEQDLSNGTVIENEASIFFDFNEPIITNTAFHTIGENFVTVNTQKIFLSNLAVRTFPNPFKEMVNFEIEGAQFQSIQLNVYDLTGRLIRTSTHAENKFSFFRNQLLSGMYVYTLVGDGAMISSGKITVQ